MQCRSTETERTNEPVTMSDEMKKYNKFFTDADSDNDGYLTLEELTAMLRRNGYRESDDKIKNMFLACDVSGDNKISRDEFLSAMGQIPEKSHQEGAMRSCFRMFDSDGTGTIDRRELLEALRGNASELNEDDVERIFRMVDANNSGTIDYEEFISYVFGKGLSPA